AGQAAIAGSRTRAHGSRSAPPGRAAAGIACRDRRPRRRRADSLWRLGEEGHRRRLLTASAITAPHPRKTPRQGLPEPEPEKRRRLLQEPASVMRRNEWGGELRSTRDALRHQEKLAGGGGLDPGRKIPPPASWDV